MNNRYPDSLLDWFAGQALHGSAAQIEKFLHDSLVSHADEEATSNIISHRIQGLTKIAYEIAAQAVFESERLAGQRKLTKE